MFLKMTESTPSSCNKAVLITGASTGIGRDAALTLAKRGFQVFAGVRRQEDADNLREEPADQIEPIIIDVTLPDTIRAARESVNEKCADTGLWGLVNNAGIGVNGAIEFVPIENLRHQLEVNVIGQVAVTQAFASLIRKAHGRIVNISSVSGQLSFPFIGPYCASKYAIEAISDAMRYEMRHLDVKVIIIEPGCIETPIWEKSLARAQAYRDSLPPEAHELYGAMGDKVRAHASRSAEHAIPVHHVSRAIIHALTSKHPRIRYRVGMDSKIGSLVRRFMPDRIFDWLVAKNIGPA